MAVQLRNNRLALCMAISLLAHVLAFFSLGLVLRLDTNIAKQRIVGKLEARLSQSLPSKAQPAPGKKLLASPAPAPLKIAQSNIKSPSDSVLQPPAQAIEQAPLPKSEVGGVAFPSVVATPWMGKIRPNNPFIQSHSSQQDAARTYQQQAAEAQARLQSAQRAQVVILQLQQLLAKRLDVQPVVTGKCMLAGPGADTNDLLVCDSPALYEAINKDEKIVAQMLIALRDTESLLRGFSVEIHADRIGIILVEQ